MKILVKILFDTEEEFRQHMSNLFTPAAPAILPAKPIDVHPIKYDQVEAVLQPQLKSDEIEKDESLLPAATHISTNDHIDYTVVPEEQKGTRTYASRQCNHSFCTENFIPTGPAQKYCPKCTDKNQKLKIKLNKLKKENPAPIKEPDIERYF